MALENIVAADLRRSQFIAGSLGLVCGFSFWYGLKENLRFAGSHCLLSVLSFNLGMALGQTLIPFVALSAVGFLFRHSGTPRYG